MFLEWFSSDMFYSVVLFLAIFLSIMVVRSIFLKLILRKIILISRKKNKKHILFIIECITLPLRLLFLALALILSTQVLPLGDTSHYFMGKIFNCVVLFSIFLAIFNYSSFLAESIAKFMDKEHSKIRKDIITFIQTLLKIFISFIGFAVLLQEWGYNISTLVASLGIGGLAFALAAKDTLANIFGYFVVFTESPFVRGDWIKIGDLEGTVESIDVRSTKVRTFYQSLISVPNSVLTTSSIENFSKMGKRRIKMNIGLTYNTSQEQLENIVSSMKKMLYSHSGVDNNTVFVFFNSFSDSSLDVFCYFFTISTNWEEYLRVKEDVYFNIMKIVKENHSTFAFPTQSIYVEK